MKVRLQTRYASPYFTGRPGDELDVSDEEARDLIAGNYAVEVKEQEEKAVAPVAVIETAAVVPPELAASRAGRQGSRGRSTAPATPKAE